MNFSFEAKELFYRKTVTSNVALDLQNVIESTEIFSYISCDHNFVPIKAIPFSFKIQSTHILFTTYCVFVVTSSSAVACLMLFNDTRSIQTEL